MNGVDLHQIIGKHISIKWKSKMIDRSDENDLIPSADELREEVIDKSILDKQNKGWKVIRTKLKMANKSGMHTITLYK